MKETIKIWGIFIIFSMLTTSCSYFEDDEEDYKYMVEVVNPKAFVENDKIKLTWDNPDDPDFVSVLIQVDFGPSGYTYFYSEPREEEILIELLPIGQEYTFLVKAVNTSGIASDGVEVKYIPYE